jgi:hypothetical protein
VNANQAGAALVLGMIFTVGLLQRKFKYCMFLILVGILMTFSRTALMGWILITTILLFQNTLSKKHFIVGMGILVFIFY